MTLMSTQVRKCISQYNHLLRCGMFLLRVIRYATELVSDLTLTSVRPHSVWRRTQSQCDNCWISYFGCTFGVKRETSSKVKAQWNSCKLVARNMRYARSCRVINSKQQMHRVSFTWLCQPKIKFDWSICYTFAPQWYRTSNVSIIKFYMTKCIEMIQSIWARAGAKKWD